jgi:hypothetical protein
MKEEMDINPEQPDDKTIFASLDVIRAFERLIHNLEITRLELLKVAEAMKPVES